MAGAINFLPPDLQSEQAGVDRKRKLAEALLQQGMAPLDGARSAGRFMVAPSALEGLAKVLQTYGGLKGGEVADKAAGDIGRRAQVGRQEAIARALQTAQGATGVAQDTSGEGTGSFDMGGMAGPAVTGQRAPDPLGAYTQLAGSGDPLAMQAGGQMLSYQQKEKENELNRQAKIEEKLMTLDAAAQNSALSREERAARAKEAEALRREMQQNQFAQQRSMAGLASSLRQPQAPVVVMGPDGKPMYVSPADAVGKRPAGKEAAKLPASALKLQQEEVEALGIASTIGADIGAVVGQLSPRKDPTTGAELPPELQLGPVKNVVGNVRNTLGMSNENSRNLGTFEATLEKLRNDSLRLNKGVQTEGDAVRAWNEILKNINDQAFVKKRLGEVQKINERAANLRRLNIDTIRANFGVDPMDTTAIQNQPAAIGAGGGSGAWKVVR